LRTPISMMQGYSEAIVDGIAESNEEKVEMAKIIYDESLRLGRLVNELLDLARMEAGYNQLTISQVETKSYLDRIIRKFHGLAKDKNIDLTSDIGSVDEYFFFDPDRIEQVLTNLIDNAIRHTPNDGLIKVSANTDDQGLYVEVFNTG